jgi:hypothetical protein
MRWPWRRRRPESGSTTFEPVRRWAEPAYPPADVRLGFADGSEVAIDAADPTAVAFRAVADLLVQED